MYGRSCGLSVMLTRAPQTLRSSTMLLPIISDEPGISNAEPNVVSPFSPHPTGKFLYQTLNFVLPIPTVDPAAAALVQEPGSTEDPALVEEQADRTKRIGLPADAPLQTIVAKVEVGAVERNRLDPAGGRGCAKVGDLPVCAHSQSHHRSSIRRLAGEGQQCLAPRAGAANAAN